jgi:conjugative transfer signal peptidase TraF
MVINSRSFARLSLLLAATLLIGVSLAEQAGLCMNRTVSMPTGFYWSQPRPATLQRNVLVLFCPPDTPLFRLAQARHYVTRGHCPYGSQSLLKPVAAVSGDTVRLTAIGIERNGMPIPNSKPMTHDSGGRPLPHFQFGRYRVQPGEVWLVSSYSSKSFDSRYFGPVATRNITRTVTPLFTW